MVKMPKDIYISLQEWIRLESIKLEKELIERTQLKCRNNAFNLENYYRGDVNLNCS